MSWCWCPCLAPGRDAEVRAEELARIVAWIRSKEWNSMQDWNGDPFEGDYQDVAKAIADCIERGDP